MTQSTQSISVAEASARLSEIVAAMAPNDEIALTIDGKTVAKLIRLPIGPRRQSGHCAGQGTLPIIKEDTSS
jgi:antitoxin (DNA-binding transcriptional repressor) of toxin-antitoxin stability system